MKPLLYSCILPFILLCYCQPANAKGNTTVPYRIGKAWGASDEHGNIIVPCRYTTVTCSGNWVFAYDSSGKKPVKIFDNTGHLVDTCHSYQKMQDGRFLILSRAAQPVSSSFFRMNDAQKSIYATSAFTCRTEVTIYDAAVTAYVLSPDKSKTPVPGALVATAHNETRAVIVLNGKAGVFNLLDGSMTLPAEYDSLIFIKPDILLAFKNGASLTTDFMGATWPFSPPADAMYANKEHNTYVLKAPLTPSFVVDTVSGGTDPITGKHVTRGTTRATSNAGYRTSGYRLMGIGGRELIAAERDWEYEKKSQPRYIRMRKPYDSVKYGTSAFQMAGIDGTMQLWSVEEIQAMRGDLLHITDRSLTTYQHYFYNTRLGRVVLHDSSRKARVETGKGLPEIKRNGLHFYYNDKGDLLGIIADSVSVYQKEWNLVKKLELKYPDSLFRATGNFTHDYIALRSDTAQPFTVYDEHFNKVATTYTDIRGNSPAFYFAYRENGRWGIIGEGFRVVEPPACDEAPVISEGWATVVKNGKKMRIPLSGTGPAIDLSHFDEFGVSSWNGRYLALRYAAARPYPAGGKRVETLFIADSLGNATDSMAMNDSGPYRYAFTAGGRIVRYPGNGQGGEVSVMNGLRMAWQKAPYATASVQLCNGVALLLLCRNDKNELGMVATDDLTPVVPFGKYDFMFTYPRTFTAKDGTAIHTLEIKGGTEEWHKKANDTRRDAMLFGKPETSDRETVGFYSQAARKYWKN